MNEVPAHRMICFYTDPYTLKKGDISSDWDSNQQSKYFFFFFFLILVCEAIGTAATPGLLCQPRMIVKMIVEKQMECRLAGETEVFEENLPQRHFCPSQNPT
jgi:hypothetical protein